jgi:hypothetical protein
MSLEVPGLDVIVDQPGGGVDDKDKGKGKLRRSEQFDYKTCLFLFNKQWHTASSYYPGRGDKTHVLAHHDSDYPDTDIEDNSETEKDWLSDDHTAGPSKFSQAIAAEVSVWITPLCACAFHLTNFFIAALVEGSTGRCHYVYCTECRFQHHQ